MFAARIQQADFEPASLEAELRKGSADVGASVCFTGYVRRDPERPQLSGLFLEHYPGMTEKSIETLMSQAAERWPLCGALVLHRVGPLRLGERIVWVGVSSAHRAAAFSACDYLMDILKTSVPLWKRELGLPGEPWVQPRPRDQVRAARWNKETL